MLWRRIKQGKGTESGKGVITLKKGHRMAVLGKTLMKLTLIQSTTNFRL